MFNFGEPHATLQQFDCSATDFKNLLERLPDSDNPFITWKSKDKFYKIKSSKVTSWFPSSKCHAVFHSFQSGPDDDTLSSLSYAELHKCIDDCPPYDADLGITVAVLLPSAMMAEMAVVLVSLLAKPNVCIAPMDANMSEFKLCEALEQLNCQGVVTTADLFAKMDFLGRECKFHDIRVVEPSSNKLGAVQWKIIHQEPLAGAHGASNMEEKPVILLRTSGTTSVPKVVPLTASSLLYNAICIAASLRLRRDDVGCNAMPLFHIGGISCALLAVLVSGSSVVMMAQFDPENFLDCITSTEMKPTVPSTPTWYYGVPSMHKALVLTAQARLQQQGVQYFPNKLRFIRSGAAHLPHETALELSKIFRTNVFPTYSMSEAMPICSYHTTPVVWDDDNNGNIPNAVGHPIGCHLKIVNELGNALPYGSVGEVALSGPGVMKQYSGMARNQSHTPDGFLRTGDIGELDESGVLTLKGRLREMIKRGGEQVWPNEVDRVVEQVSGVSTAVTFGVPNDLWGEEVAVAVILDNEEAAMDCSAMERSISSHCRKYLESAAVPAQIVFVPTTDNLLKGPTGKYLRTRLAEHLDLRSVDTGALRILEARVQKEPNQEQQKGLVPSSALNGVRLVTAYFVVQTHVGFYPSNTWLKIQSYTLDMPIFFMLAGFQLACSTKNSVWQNWGQWVGTKIGAMHALFVATQLIGLPSYLLFQCGEDGYQEQYAGSSCKESMKSFIPLFVLQTATGMVPRYDAVNPPAWFQTAFYMFLMMFPPLDAHLRKLPARGLVWRLILNLFIASVFFVFVHNFLLEYLVVGWLPTLVSAMIAGYFFTRYAVNNAGDATSFFQRPRVQGVIADLLSAVFLLFEVVVSLSPDCAYVEAEDYLVMRPGEPLPTDPIVVTDDDVEFVYACYLTHDEFLNYVHDNEINLYNGRLVTEFGQIVGWYRVATPLVLLWLYALAQGHGLTARIMNCVPLQWLAPMAYPLYLLHVSVARYYWLATRGLEAQHWFADATGFPFPVEWYETFIIIAISLALGLILDRTVVPFLTRYTVSLGVSICQWVERRICCCCKQANLSTVDASSSISSMSNLDRVQDLIKHITGNNQISASTDLRDLGLDSLGATALLGTLRASVPAARKLTLFQLIAFETVGDLVGALDAVDPTEKPEDKDTDAATRTTQDA
eukprot:CAMPEP_0178878994 /NCGR_PEP_ID=MMETSP0747-20121128/11694_1 /TAXON_ID=913974 /ORGANISM="Nitzschia punctata, Strain CCMP561" /LENGTH=1169 /DNA_ID=CAMNT_0020546793 /DNA_START=50 /DNA_END=3559 /DNA_ORIENTATION=-